MFQIISLIFFLLTIFSSGFITLNKILKIKSNILLISLCIPLGISLYICTTHIISFLTGPKTGCIIGLLILFLLSILTQILSNKESIEKELKKNKLFFLVITSVIISILTYCAMFRFGFFDKAFHIPLTLTMFHNDVYPPRDFFRPQYLLLYHFGGDLLAGSLHQISRIDISTCFEIISSILAGTTFLCFFSLAWILTKNFRVSLIAGFCTYFGGGFLWLDTIIRYLSGNLPQIGAEWGFTQTFINLGVHGSIINPPSILAISCTSSLGNPILITSLILLWEMVSKKRNEISYIILINISLFSLFLSAEWLYATFFVGIVPLLISIVLKKDFKSIKVCSILVFSSIFLVKTIGNALLLEDFTQTLGRTNIFDLGIKENLFSINTWGRLNSALNVYSSVSCFSWDFISEFGFSLLLIPIAIVYLIKSKNLFSFILFSCALFTMPAPTIIDFKANATDLNRLFCFGNSMLILLITCGLGSLLKDFYKNKLVTFTYIFCLCLSPVSQLILGVLFTPNIFSERTFSQEVFNGFKKVHNYSDLIQMYKDFNNLNLIIKNGISYEYAKEIDFLHKISKPGDLVLSSIPELPFYAGLYSLTPPGKFIYQDIIYSTNDSVFLNTFNTLNPHLLKELNIKWILINNTDKIAFPEEIKQLLNNKDLFESTYLSKSSKDTWIEIFKVKDLNNKINNYKQTTSWILINRSGEPIEISFLKKNNISLFKSFRSALFSLNQLMRIDPTLKKERITVKLVIDKELEKYIEVNRLNLVLQRVN